MVIKLLQQSTFRWYAAIVLSPFFYFCCFRCVTVPLTGVINYVFCIYLLTWTKTYFSRSLFNWKTSSYTLDTRRQPHYERCQVQIFLVRSEELVHWGSAWPECCLVQRGSSVIQRTKEQPHGRLAHDPIKLTNTCLFKRCVPVLFSLLTSCICYCI